MLYVRCLAMGFLLSKARLAGQFFLARLSGARGPLHQWGIIAPALTIRVNVPGDRLRTQLADDGISTALADLEEERGTFRRLARKVRRNVDIRLAPDRTGLKRSIGSLHEHLLARYQEAVFRSELDLDGAAFEEFGSSFALDLVAFVASGPAEADRVEGEAGLQRR
jgi:hypothetical protein